MREQIAVTKAYGEALITLARKDERVFVVDADLSRSCGTDLFAKEFPDRWVQVGLAEQNMVSLAAGLASCGKVPFTNTFGVFASRRVCDQVAISVALNRFNVKLCGTSSGLTGALNGPTHQALEDVAIIRSLPNMVIVEPGDTLELAQAVDAVAAYDGPVYLRLARGTMPRCLPEGNRFVLGKAAQLRDGGDVTLIGAGIMVPTLLDAAAMLAEVGISARVLNMSTIKPLDAEAVLKAAEETGAIVTAENHNIIGGLGGAVAELLVEECPVPMRRIGVRDSFGETASQPWLLEKYGLTAPRVVEAARQAIEKKRR